MTIITDALLVIAAAGFVDAGLACRPPSVHANIMNVNAAKIYLRIFSSPLNRIKLM